MQLESGSKRQFRQDATADSVHNLLSPFHPDKDFRQQITGSSQDQTPDGIGPGINHMRLKPLLLLLILSLTSALGFPSHADVRFHVKNCTDQSIGYWTFDGGDSLRIIQASHGTLSAFHPAEKSGESDARFHTISCETGSHCQLYLHPSEFFNKTFKYNIGKNVYMRIISLVQFEYDDPAIAAREGTQYALRFTLSSGTERCDDPTDSYASLAAE